MGTVGEPIQIQCSCEPVRGGQVGGNLSAIQIELDATHARWVGGLDAQGSRPTQKAPGFEGFPIEARIGQDRPGGVRYVDRQ